MHHGHRPPQLNPHQIQAYLAGWYDLVGPQVGNVPGYHGAYGGQRSLGYPHGTYLGVDPATGAPVVVPAPAPPMGPPPGFPMGPPPGFGFEQPRAAVVNAPLPTQANRDILPMSTGVPILPTQSAQITGRPQVLVFKIGRFMISNAARPADAPTGS